MSEENQNQKQAKTARDAVTRVQSQIKEAKRKAYEAELKKRVEELNAAEIIFKEKQATLEDLIIANEDLY